MTYPKESSFLKGRIKSVYYAARGAYHLVRTEHSVIAQLIIAAGMTAIGWYFEITATEWMMQWLTIGLVLAIEGLNTAVEKLLDFIHPEEHPRVGLIKDIAAGAVFFTAIIAIIVGLHIYVPYLKVFFCNTN